MDKLADLGKAHLRVARPSDDLAAVVKFYRDGLGLYVLNEFKDHEGFMGELVAHPGVDARLGWSAAGVPAEHAIRGLYSITLWLDANELTGQLLTNTLGFKLVREQEWPFPYLHDESQDVARALGAEVTPHVFVLDSEQRLAYRGAPDSDYDDPAQRAAWLRDALDAVLAGDEPPQAETRPVGCSIKWKA